MFSYSPQAAAQPTAPTSSVLWTNMESNKVMCPTFSVMLVRTIKALCEINVRFDHKLEISGSLHVRSDGDKVMTCLIDEESIKGAQDLSILDAVRFTMPYAAAALAPMALPGGFGQQPGQIPEALMSPVAQAAMQPTSMSLGTDKEKHSQNNGNAAGVNSRPDHRDAAVVNMETDRDRLEVPAQQMDMTGLGLVNSRPPELQVAEAEAALLLQRRLSNEVLPRPATSSLPADVQAAPGVSHRASESARPSSHKSSGGKSKSNHSSGTPPSSGCPASSASSHQGPPLSHESLPATTAQQQAASAATGGQQNHVKLPNIQTFAGMLPRLPQIKTESKESISPLPRSSEPPSFPSPPQNLSTSPLSGGGGGYVDPLVGVKIEVQSQVDAEGNIVQKKKFQCMFCGIFLSTKCYLKNHINAMHTKARVYPCEVCEKYFYSAGALRIHKLRNHWQGSKKHKCDHCGETFLLPIELRKHLMKKHAEMEDLYEGGGGGPGSSGGMTPISGLQVRTDPSTAPSSASSSPRAFVEKSGFPTSGTLGQNLTQAALLHSSPVFPALIPHTTSPAVHKELVAAAAAAAIAMDTSTEVSVTHSAPVFPSPVPQSLAQAASAHKPAINAASVSESK